MKNQIKGLILAVLCSSLLPAQAQFGRPGGGAPQLNAAMAKLFGDNQAFSANMEADVQMQGGQNIQMPGKMSFDSGKSRFEMDLSQAKGNALPPEMASQMKAMGMDKMVIIGRPDQKASYMVYPGLKGYVQMPNQDGEAKPESFKMELTELGKETVDGHPCVKNKAVVTDDKGTKHESTVWNATDLKNFPVKIQTTQEGTTMTMLLKNVKLAKPEASLFDPPADFKKHENMMGLMQDAMMRQGDGAGAGGGY